MTRYVKDFVEVGDHMKLGALIDALTQLRDTLPEGADADVKLRGNDFFGRHLCVSYRRLQTADESACEARYADAYRAAREVEMTRLQDELGVSVLPRRKMRAAA